MKSEKPISKWRLCRKCHNRMQSKYKWHNLCQSCTHIERKDRESKWQYNEKSLILKMSYWSMSPKIFKKEITYLWCLNKLGKIEALEILMIANIYVTVTNQPYAYAQYSTETQWRKMLRILYLSLKFRHKKLENLID